MPAEIYARNSGDDLLAAALIVIGGIILGKMLSDGSKNHKCPRCNYPVNKANNNCPNCGLPLDWTGVD